MNYIFTVGGLASWSYSYARTSNLSLRCFIAFFSFHFADFMSLPKNPFFSLTLYIKNVLFLRVIKNKSGQVGRNPKKCCTATVFRRPLFKNKWAESGQMAKFRPYKPLQRLQNPTKCPPITYQKYQSPFSILQKWAEMRPNRSIASS